MKRKTFGTLVLIIAMFTLTFNKGCKKSDSTTTPLAVGLSTDATLGQYLVDKDGRALYFFSNDYKGRNSCPGGCATVWPYFYGGTLTTVNLASGLNLEDFDTIMVKGTPQTRYKGWPLYNYAPNGASLEPAGQITGESNANWFVAKPDYTIMLANGQMVGADGKNYLSSYAEGIGKTVYFTDAKGLTLYRFTPDSYNTNKFTKSDFSNNPSWPIMDTTAIVVPSALDKTLFSSITLYGKHQLTYNGWPLYYFGGDSKTRGITKGITIPLPGTKWLVVSKDVTVAPQK